MLFEKYDTSGNGLLDNKNLVQLYNENGVNLSESELKRMHGKDKIQFSLTDFENFGTD
jgi:Ca2+-binding EF-hand superfamily protein